MQSLYIATSNVHKTAEFQRLLAAFPMDVRSLPDGLPPCAEFGMSFESNAVEKAVFYGRRLAGWVLADDSGLCVDALDGAPGVLSARYAGEHGDDAANRAKLLQALRGVPAEKRTARFVCALAAWNGERRQGLVVTGTLEGTIAETTRGQGGFGYDPIFLVPHLGHTLAELHPDEKNRISHRARAVEAWMCAWEGERHASLSRH